MRIPTHHDAETVRGEQSMTPMIDVVFLLLIFFVLASIGRKKESLMSGELAGGSMESKAARKPEHLLGEVKLYLKSDPRRQSYFQVNNGPKLAEFRQLQDKLLTLAAVTRDIPVILYVGPAVPLEDLLKVQNLCRQARFEDVRLATQKKTAGLTVPGGSSRPVP